MLLVHNDRTNFGHNYTLCYQTITIHLYSAMTIQPATDQKASADSFMHWFALANATIHGARSRADSHMYPYVLLNNQLRYCGSSLLFVSCQY